MSNTNSNEDDRTEHSFSETEEFLDSDADPAYEITDDDKRIEEIDLVEDVPTTNKRVYLSNVSLFFSNIAYTKLVKYIVKPPIVS